MNLILFDPEYISISPSEDILKLLLVGFVIYMMLTLFVLNVSYVSEDASILLLLFVLCIWSLDGIPDIKFSTCNKEGTSWGNIASKTLLI